MKIEQLNTLPAAAFIDHLSGIFEHSPWVGESVAGKRPFENLDALYEAMVEAVRQAPEELKDRLILAHPDLAGKLARSSKLTVQSEKEQKGAGLDRLSEDEFDQFQKLNEAYRAKFSFPFIIAVRGHGGKAHDKYSILANMKKRLNNDRDEEKATALTEIFRIARLRLEDLIDSEG